MIYSISCKSRDNRVFGVFDKKPLEKRESYPLNRGTWERVPSFRCLTKPPLDTYYMCLAPLVLLQSGIGTRLLLLDVRRMGSRPSGKDCSLAPSLAV